MAIVYPDFTTISKLRTPATEGEFYILDYMSAKLDSSYEIFFNPFLDGDRPDIIILKKDHGAIIIEVKDWNLTLYSVSVDNKWSVSTPEGKKQSIKSPHQQVFRYKNNMFELHLPILGMAEAFNGNFYKLIHPLVYFHNSKADDIHLLHSQALAELSFQESSLNEQRKHGQLAHETYDKRCNFISNKIRRIERDRAMSFSTDSLDKLVKKIDKIGKNNLFSEVIYEELKRRLSPPEWIYSQGKAIEFDAKQQKYIESKDGFSKVKGVAGCGKTSIIAARAISAYSRHSNVLILTFNLTLKQLIRDKISHINHHLKANVDINKIEITNYHNFFMSQLNNIDKQINTPDSGCSKKELEEFFNNEYKKSSYFEKSDTIRYNSIFIDEIQDYEKEWITIIRDHFLAPESEMVLFGDQSQNIYQRDEEPLNKSLVKGFGRWEKLTKSYRLDVNALLTMCFKEFQEKFLISRHEDLEIFESKLEQRYFNPIVHNFYDENKIDDVFYKINSYIKERKLIPNDIAIISSKIEVLASINDFFQKQEKTMTMFVTNQEREACKHNKLHDIEKIEKRKKHFFVQNSGLIKLSTIHSFKGMESETVICIFTGNEEPEVVYTAITRAKKNLVIFDKENSIYTNFFRS